MNFDVDYNTYNFIFTTQWWYFYCWLYALKLSLFLIQMFSNINDKLRLGNKSQLSFFGFIFYSNRISV